MVSLCFNRAWHWVALDKSSTFTHTHTHTHSLFLLCCIFRLEHTTKPIVFFYNVNQFFFFFFFLVSLVFNVPVTNNKKREWESDECNSMPSPYCYDIYKLANCQLNHHSHFHFFFFFFYFYFILSLVPNLTVSSPVCREHSLLVIDVEVTHKPKRTFIIATSSSSSSSFPFTLSFDAIHNQHTHTNITWIVYCVSSWYL